MKPELLALFVGCAFALGFWIGRRNRPPQSRQAKLAALDAALDRAEQADRKRSIFLSDSGRCLPRKPWGKHPNNRV